MICSSTERYRETLNALLQSIRSQVKATYCMIPTIWHPGKSKSMWPVKRSVVAKDQREGRVEEADNRALSEQWNYSVWYYNGALYICPNLIEYATPRRNINYSKR